MNYDIHDTTDYKAALGKMRAAPELYDGHLCCRWRIGDLAAMSDVGAMDALILTRTVARAWYVPEADAECSEYGQVMGYVLYTWDGWRLGDIDAANIEITVRMQDEEALLVALQLWKEKE